MFQRLVKKCGVWESLLSGNVLGWEIEVFRKTFMLPRFTEARGDEAIVAL